MKPVLIGTAAVFAIAAIAPAQTPAGPAPISGTAPIYHVTVVERTVKAVNYFYRSGPTMIDFKGTVLLPDGKGTAIVDSRQGHTDVDASFDHLRASQQYGREYLTYVLWAITPEGRPHNMGEIVPDHSDHGHLHVTTDLQAFAMIVTAEPYSAVRQPSDVVVMENLIRPDTQGRIETVNAKYELLPRGEYTWNQSAALTEEIANAPKVSTREFETLTELYQAENAVGVAASAGAGSYAPDTLARAQTLLTEAQQMHASKQDSHRVVEIARQAAQTAEDARLIAMQRQQDDKLRAAQEDINRSRAQAAAAQISIDQIRAQADSAIRQAQQDAQAANDRANRLQQQVDTDRAALAQAQGEAAAARQRAQQAEAAAQNAQIQQSADLSANRASTLRVRLLEDLNGIMAATDTPRGLVVTIPDTAFSGDAVRGSEALQIARVAAIISSQPGLAISVEGYCDNPSKTGESENRALAVRHVLINNGVPVAQVSARGLGNSRPVGPAGDPANSRIEVVVSGNPIGTLPFWDRTYSLSSSR